jgi:integrase/recombinase XerD
MDLITQLDAAGRRRSPATLPGYHTGRAPQNKGRSYPADPPRVEEIDGKGGKRREVGMDDWGWRQLEPWLRFRMELPIGALFCVVNGPTAGRPWSDAAARTQFRRLARRAGVRRRFAPHQLRHAHAVEMAREGVSLNVIQRQLGHADLGITSVYLQGIDSGEIVDVVHGRRAPVIPAAIALGS